MKIKMTKQAVRTPFGSQWRLPKNWELISVNEITSDWRGGAPFEPEDFTSHGFPVLHKGGIQRGGNILIDPKKKTFTTAEYAQSHQKSVIDKSYMAATLRDLVPSGPSIGLIADIAKSPSEKYILAQGAYGFQIDTDRVAAAYLVWLSNYEPFREYIKRYCVGSTQIHIRTPVFQELIVPLPPIAEQKRIAAILDKAEELRSLRRKALAELDAIVQSIFLEMFGDPVRNPKGWECKSIKQIGRAVTGNTPSRSQPELYGDAIEWIKSDNINTPHSYLTKASEGLSQLGKEISRIVPKCSILVTCIAGSPDCIGNAAIADREVAFNQQINALVPELGDFRFLYAQILVNKCLVQEASTSSMKGMVNKSRFEEIQLIFPKIELQENFGKAFDKIESLKATQRESLDQLDALFSSLQHRAFQGEL